MTARHLLALLTLAASSSAQGALIWDNGPFVTHPTGGTGGEPLSMVQDVTGDLCASHWSMEPGEAAAADDFLVSPFGATVDAVEFFVVESDFTAFCATAVSPVSDLRLSLWDGEPSVNLTTVPGYVMTETFTGAYRVKESTWPALQCDEIVSIRVDFPAPIALGPGAHWIEFSAQSSMVSGEPGAVFADYRPIPITTWDVQETGDAWQWFQPFGLYTPLNSCPSSDTRQGLPFRLYGTGYTPGGIMSLGGGCSSASLTVEGAPVPGGYLRLEVAGAAAPVLMIGLTNPNLTLPGCACVQEAGIELGLVSTDTATFSVPADATMLGLTIYAQAADLGAGSCSLLPVPFELTDGYLVRF
ncbi:MAG: hypothetical protein AAF682_07375 [Planctomycetota bacterium]